MIGRLLPTRLRGRVSHIEFRFSGDSAVHFCAAVDGYIWHLSIVRKNNCLHSARPMGKAKKMELSSHVFAEKSKSLSMFFFHYSAALGIIVDLVFVSCICGAHKRPKCCNVSPASTMYVTPSVIRIVAWNAGMANPKLMIGKITNQPIRARQVKEEKKPTQIRCVSIFRTHPYPP